MFIFLSRSCIAMGRSTRIAWISGNTFRNVDCINVCADEWVQMTYAKFIFLSFSIFLAAFNKGPTWWQRWQRRHRAARTNGPTRIARYINMTEWNMKLNYTYICTVFYQKQSEFRRGLKKTFEIKCVVEWLLLWFANVPTYIWHSTYHVCNLSLSTILLDNWLRSVAVNWWYDTIWWSNMMTN